MNTTHTITLCMGSSCFARGNRNHLAIIEEFLADHNLQESVVVEGSHCEELCAHGPNIRIDETLYQHLDAGTLLDILDRHLLKNGKESS